MKVAERKKLFLVDGDADEAEIYLELIKEKNLPVELYYFSRAEQMCEFLNHNDLPDVVVMDVNLPGMSGLDCLEKLKGEDCYRNVPIVMCTSSMYEPTAAQVLSSGATYYRLKPSDFAGYQKLITELCAFSSNADNNYEFGRTG
jgi:CheY-like chemotaxis protein